jgi:hypothetical protein
LLDTHRDVSGNLLKKRASPKWLCGNLGSHRESLRDDPIRLPNSDEQLFGYLLAYILERRATLGVTFDRSGQASTFI